MKILLSDDHLLLLESLSEVLTRSGHEVLCASTPQEAVERAHDEHAEVCVLDLNFPEGNGIDAARAILQDAPETVVVILTGAPEGASARAALELGVRGYLRKDQPLRTMLDALDQVIAGSVVIDHDLLIAHREPPAAVPLTPREQEVLERIVQGCSATTIAARLGVSYSTVRTHTQSLLMKLGARSCLQASAIAVREGLVEAAVVRGAAGESA